MPAIHGALNKFHAGFQLGRLPTVIIVAQIRVTAYLTQSGKLCENLQLLLIEVSLVRGCKLCLHLNYLCIIEPLLFLTHPDSSGLLQLIRQILKYIALQTAEDEWIHHLLQAVGSILLTVFYDRCLEFLLEGFISIQESRHQIVKYAPQLT